MFNYEFGCLLGLCHVAYFVCEFSNDRGGVAFFFQEPVHKENERTMGFIVQSTKVAFVADLQKLSSCQRRAC